MNNKETIKKDLSIGMDFIHSIIQSPDLVNDIPNGSTISFLDEAGSKIETADEQKMERKFVKVKRSFELL